MTPSCSAFHATDGRLIDAVFGCNHSLKPRVRTYGYHLSFCQFRQTMTLARLTSAVQPLIRVVRNACSPSKIRGGAVTAVAIVVGALHSIRARAEERLSDERVNVIGLVSAIHRQVHTKVAALFVDERCPNTARNAPRPAAARFAGAGLTAHPAQVTDREQPLKAKNWFPYFIHAGEHAMTMQQFQDKGYGVAKNRFVAG